MQSLYLPYTPLQPGLSPSLSTRSAAPLCPLFPSSLFIPCRDTHPSVAYRLSCPAGRLSCPHAMVPALCPRSASCPHFARWLPDTPPPHPVSLGSAFTCKHADSLAGANMLVHMHTQSFGQGSCALAQSPQREPVYWDPGAGCRNKRSFVRVYVKVTNSK